MGLKLLAGRWFDANPPIDDATRPYPPEPEAETGAGGARHERRRQRIGGEARLPRPQEALGKVVKGELSARSCGLINIDDHRGRRGFALPHGPRADRADHVPQ